MKWLFQRSFFYVLLFLLTLLPLRAATLTMVETGGPVINEFVAANSNSLKDEDADTPDWIEIYNGQNASVNLSGWTLTNAENNRSLWTFPEVTIGPYQYLIVFASGKNRTNASLPLHTSFTLQRERGYLALVQPDGATVAIEFAYQEQAEDVSFGIAAQESGIGYLYPPSPRAANIASHGNGPPAEDVAFSHEGGLITSMVTLTIGAPKAPDAVVRYTTDNSIPSATSPLYSSPFNVSGTSIIRARVFAPGRLPGPVSSRTFVLVDASMTNYNNSGEPFSSNLPIIVLDSFGSPVDNYFDPVNRPYTFTYGVVISPDPTTGRATITDLPSHQGRSSTHVRGESSSVFPQRQYAWELRNEEDGDKAASLLGLPAESDWILYGPSTEKTLLRDVLIFGTMRKWRSDYMAARTQFCEVFFNQTGADSVGYSNSYRGIYVLKEKLKIDKDRVNLAKISPLTTEEPAISGGYLLRKDKSGIANTAWMTSQPYEFYLQSYDPSTLNNAQYNYIKGYIDNFHTALAGDAFTDPDTGYAAFIEPDTFIDAQWFVEWTKQVDGYVYSTYFHKDRGRRLRAGPIWDFNISLGNADYATGDTPTGWLYDTSGTATGTGSLYYPRLHEDPSYRLRHWDRYWEMRRSVLSTPTLWGDIDNLAGTLLNGSTTPVTNGMAPRPPMEENAVMRHYRKYQSLGTYQWPNGPGYASRVFYNSNGDPQTGEIDALKEWLRVRLSWIDDQNIIDTAIYRPPNMNRFGGRISPGFELTISRYTGTPPSGTTYADGTLYYTVDGTDPRDNSAGIGSSAKIYSSPITLEGPQTVSARLYNNGTWSPVTTATFIVDAVPASAANLVVSEFHYHPHGPTADEAAVGFASGSDFEFIELFNVSGETVDLTGVTIADAVDFRFEDADPAKNTLEPGGRVIIAGDIAAFSFRYGHHPSLKVAGAFLGNLSNSGEHLTVIAADGSIIAKFTWSDKEPWPAAADGDGYSLVLNNPSPNTEYDDEFRWRASAQTGGHPGFADSTAFTGNLTADKDADGLSDFLEYALGSDPDNPASAYTPIVELTPFKVGGVTSNYLRLQYRRNLSADGCRYSILFSENLSQWQVGRYAVTYVGTTHNGDGTATVTYRSNEPLESGRINAFMRLRVDRQE